MRGQGSCGSGRSGDPGPGTPRPTGRLVADVTLSGAVATLVVAGLAAAGWITLWSAYAWGQRDLGRAAVLGIAIAACLGLPAALLAVRGHWRGRRGLPAALPGRASFWLDVAGVVLVALLAVLACLNVVAAAYWGWAFCNDGTPLASAYYLLVALAMLTPLVAVLTAREHQRGSRQPDRSPTGAST